MKKDALVLTKKDVLVLIVLIITCAFPCKKTNNNVFDVSQKYIYIQIEHDKDYTRAPSFLKTASNMRFDDFGCYTITTIIICDKKIPKLLSVYNEPISSSRLTKHKDHGQIFINGLGTKRSTEATIQLDYQTFLYMSKSLSKKFLLIGEKENSSNVCSVYLKKK